MRTIYEPEHAIEANIIAGLLKQAGISAHIAGEYLQGAAGELPVFGLVRIMVADEDAEAARQLIEEWNNGQPLLDEFEP
jgi:hypothetical protein